MARSVILACNLNEPTDFTFIRQESDVDGSFLVNCILGQTFLTPNASAILVCMHHTYDHYFNAGKRLNFNLNDARNRGNLIVIDVLKATADTLCKFDSATIKPETVVSDIVADIELKVADLLRVKSSVTVILDDVHSLSHLKANEHLILALCRRLQRFSEMLAPKLRVIIKLHNSNLYECLANNISMLAQSEIQVNKLTSGYSKEVDGRLVVKRSNGFDGEKTVLYKVNERNIVVMQPGEPGLNIC
ncbi:uncharacterized protein LOC119070047 [Bradysia coprophila]|uniref:uncharacterized protein LOC119070047 n=1 Tax=Bradysia coprophila TaxID=38358 RepID=UPI00187DA6C9|nr:uncharacterized protein LOC119070047 [Bradysia coprophila]XP_037030229.1 uncharacterized protein LOC119070047 [Bradysia coprophila]XP_037030230.1 uncharacterized protein LOC119070047 [Bradysia coprophila]XP_037030231.1 uncharacterized protein LOC119070047 [Bradysia coprophila]XP_037030232.1 uncharacterized protein LOC119070047 [Bradysia coprophila]XP_037030233.1 uncharacterized protein LOC119070047 [Bradysia coprophila]XP_037030234.1 uncharacterized protein LOC119070047 [Bradysia coprophil